MYVYHLNIQKRFQYSGGAQTIAGKATVWD